MITAQHKRFTSTQLTKFNRTKKNNEMPTKNTQPSKMQKSYNFLAMFFLLQKLQKRKLNKLTKTI